ncbi:hypothetical protein D7V64_15450 [Acinetobacter cumulans]|jgi:hypothetical protein|uniref:Uncharacterized protein n=1 Tax=Acinetobacter cumulans TaxID=2136182 RepID=A0A3A8FMT1_9GAMM|nr:hypothetical protein [Acinetobacter cumulans]RKG48305.1 hypothetical protein D7V64_15450 [Acinetobacter cumulans]
MASFNKIKTKSRLSELFGCEESLFLQIIKDAYLCRTETTNNHPKTYGGTKQYNEGICFLREELASHGFIAYEQLGSNWALNKAKNVAITVMAGNSWVGRIGGFSTNQKALKPKQGRNRNPRGSMFSKIAHAQLQDDLFSQSGKPSFYCWVLMYFIDFKANVIRSEIACPSKMTTNGRYIEQYYERIMLSEISIDMDQEIEDSILPVQSTQNEEVEEFDFEVALKKRG